MSLNMILHLVPLPGTEWGRVLVEENHGHGYGAGRGRDWGEPADEETTEETTAKETKVEPGA